MIIVGSPDGLEQRYPKRPGMRRLVIDLTGTHEEMLMPIPQELLLDLELRGIKSPDLKKQALELLDKWERNHSIPSIRSMYRSGRWETVIEHCNRRLECYPSEIEIHVLLIRSLYSISKYQECIEICDRLLSHQPSNIDALRFIARSAKQLGQDTISTQMYMRILDLNPEDTDSRIMLIRYNYKLKEWKQVMRYCDELLEILPEARDGLLFKVRVLHQLGEWGESLVYSQKLFERDNTDIEGIIECGRSLFNLNRIEESQYYFELALELSPEEKRAKRTLAIIFERSKQWEKALDIHISECISNPSLYSNWEKRINVLYSMNREDDAKRTLDHIDNLLGDSIEGNILSHSIAESYYWKEEMDELLNTAINKWNQNTEYHSRMIDFNLKRGNLTKVLFHINKSRAIAFENERIDSIEEQFRKLLKSTNTSIEEVQEILDDGGVLYHSECAIRSIVEKCAEVPIRQTNNSAQNVAIVSSSLGRGGAERQVVACLTKLSNDELITEVNLHCNSIDNSRGNMDTYADEICDLDITIHEYGEITNLEKRYPKHIEELKKWKPYLETLSPEMQKVIEPLFLSFMETKPDVVHAWQDETNVFAAIAALMAGIPGIILFARSQRPDAKTMIHIRKRPYLRRAYDTILKHPRVMLCVNSNAGSESYSKWLDIPTSRLPVIHNGIDFESLELTSKYSKIPQIMAEYKIPRDAIIVGSVFRFVQAKQPKLWVDVMERVISERKDVHAVLVGGGNLFKGTKEYVTERKMDGNIHLVGQSKQVKAWLDEFEIFLLTSSIEGLPNVLIEAQAFGVPVVSTNAGGAMETFIDDVSGKLCNDFDPEMIADIVIECIDDGEWLENAGSAGSVFAANNFSIDSMYDRLKELYFQSLER